MLATLAALALAAEAPTPAPPAAAETPPATDAPRPWTVAGKIGAVALPESRVVLEASNGPVALSIDRNTLVYVEGRQGTTRDLTAGIPARASLGPSGLAYWIELRPKGVIPTAAPTSPPTPPPAEAPPATR